MCNIKNNIQHKHKSQGRKRYLYIKNKKLDGPRSHKSSSYSSPKNNKIRTGEINISQVNRFSSELPFKRNDINFVQRSLNINRFFYDAVASFYLGAQKSGQPYFLTSRKFSANFAERLVFHSWIY